MIELTKVLFFLEKKEFWAQKGHFTQLLATFLYKK